MRNDFATFSRQVFGIIDWLPLRATAIGLRHRR
jgi:cobalamin biosynthesis protein CobD/CbiB